MKHHEVIIDFNRRGIAALLKRTFARPRESELSARAVPDAVPLRTRLQRAWH